MAILKDPNNVNTTILTGANIEEIQFFFDADHKPEKADGSVNKLAGKHFWAFRWNDKIFNTLDSKFKERLETKYYKTVKLTVDGDFLNLTGTTSNEGELAEIEQEKAIVAARADLDSAIAKAAREKIINTLGVEMITAENIKKDEKLSELVMKQLLSVI